MIGGGGGEIDDERVRKSRKGKLGFVPRQTPIEKHRQKWVQKVHFSSEAFIYKALEE